MVFIDFWPLLIDLYKLEKGKKLNCCINFFSSVDPTEKLIQITLKMGNWFSLSHMTKRFKNNTVCNRSLFDDFRCHAIKNCTVQTIEYSQNRSEWIKTQLTKVARRRQCGFSRELKYSYQKVMQTPVVSFHLKSD